MRRWWTVTAQDIALSWKYARGGIAAGAALFFAAALRYQAGAREAAVPTLSEYFCDAFAGNLPFAPEAGAPFVLPAVWFALMFFCAHSSALFPDRMRRGMGAARLMRAKSRLRWWGRMMVLSVFWSAVYLAAGMACMAAAGWICTGAPPKADIQPGQFWTVFLTLCALSELQAACSALLSPFVGQALLVLLLTGTAFWDFPLLWPRWAMLLRGAHTVLYPALLFLAIPAAGARLFQKCDIVSHGKER